MVNDRFLQIVGVGMILVAFLKLVADQYYDVITLSAFGIALLLAIPLRHESTPTPNPLRRLLFWLLLLAGMIGLYADLYHDFTG